MASSHQESAGIGVIGVGGMGTRHALNVHRFVKGARLAGIYDVDEDRISGLTRECPDAIPFDSPGNLIGDERVDAVIVASPDHTHVEFTQQCLEAGKPVLCEKPLSTSSDDARTLLDAEEALGRRLVTVGFMRRFDPPHAALLEDLESNRIGRARLYKGVHRNRFVPPASPGEHYIHQAAVHDIDSARWLLDAEVETVYVRGARVNSSIEETAKDLLLLDLSLSDDLFAVIEVYLSAQYGYEVTAEIVGDIGSITTLPPDRTVVRGEAARSVVVPGDWLERFSEAYIREVRHWIDHLNLGSDPSPLATAWDGYISMLVADACVESLDSGQTVKVSYPPKPELY